MGDFSIEQVDLQPIFISQVVEISIVSKSLTSSRLKTCKPIFKT